MCVKGTLRKEAVPHERTLSAGQYRHGLWLLAAPDNDTLFYLFINSGTKMLKAIHLPVEVSIENCRQDVVEETYSKSRGLGAART